MRFLAALLLLALAACGGGPVGFDQSSDTTFSSATVTDASGTAPRTDEGSGSPSTTAYASEGSSSSGRYASEAEQATTTTGSGNDAVTTTTSGGKTVPTTTSPPGSYEPALQPLVDQAMADLAGRLGPSGGSITVLGAEVVMWPDASLGCPQPGMAYIQVPYDGSRIRLAANGIEYRYHTGGSATTPFLCEN